MTSVIHDHAFSLATIILEMIAPALREEEKREAFRLFYEAATASFQHYEMMSDRRMKRIKPSKN